MRPLVANIWRIYHANTSIGKEYPFEKIILFHGNGFREVSGLVDVAAAADGDVVGEELEGNYFEDGEE
jgi:hypothetical protein